MRLGAALPLGALDGGALGAESFASAAKTIEELGYSSVWTFDAVGRGFMLPDPLMALTAVAGATERDFEVFGGDYGARFTDFERQWNE
ncbi:MAG: LLM class flavin-dependent oxidoreductase, partial [Acidimicrobiales bacterium]